MYSFEPLHTVSKQIPQFNQVTVKPEGNQWNEIKISLKCILLEELFEEPWMFTLQFEFESFMLVIIKYVKSDVRYVFLFLLFLDT